MGWNVLASLANHSISASVSLALPRSAVTGIKDGYQPRSIPLPSNPHLPLSVFLLTRAHLVHCPPRAHLGTHKLARAQLAHRLSSTSRHPHAHPGTIGNTSDNPFLASWTNQDAQPYPPDPPANALGNLIAQIEAARAAPPGRNREFLVQTCRRLCRELGFTLESFTNEFRGEGEAGGSGSAHRG
ncbi:uncharacterized protein IL334_006798 [Kwoniella shivajii]|uniref:Uncharacterized protein n=1 Tax=Kwoniella shivajii TaxID=564305 RepID=A0ABZ1DAV9_9TREE|nr:hypothetical protein IL334_006798 [Kwoniella shivajii]